MNFNSIKFFLDSFKASVYGLDSEDWVVTSIGSGRCNDEWYWTIYLKNSKAHEEKIIRILCYKD